MRRSCTAGILEDPLIAPVSSLCARFDRRSPSFPSFREILLPALKRMGGPVPAHREYQSPVVPESGSALSRQPAVRSRQSCEAPLRRRRVWADRASGLGIGLPVICLSTHFSGNLAVKFLCWSEDHAKSRDLPDTCDIFWCIYLQIKKVV